MTKVIIVLTIKSNYIAPKPALKYAQGPLQMKRKYIYKECLDTANLIWQNVVPAKDFNFLGKFIHNYL